MQAPTDELLDGGFVGPAGVGRAYALDRQLLEMVDAVEFGVAFDPENEIGHWISSIRGASVLRADDFPGIPSLESRLRGQSWSLESQIGAKRRQLITFN